METKFKQIKIEISNLIKVVKGLEEITDNDSFAREYFENEISLLKNAIKSLEDKLNNSIIAYCENLNIQDGRYDLIKVIDGDTIRLVPPNTLLNNNYMKDMDVRLYGYDAPEKKDEFFVEYKTLLSKLFELIASNTVALILERQSPITEHANYTKYSFHRMMGNVFIDFNEKLFYVNSFLAMFPHTTYYNNKKFKEEKKIEYYIGGLKKKRLKYSNNYFFDQDCKTFIGKLSEVINEIEGFADLSEIGYPSCLLFFPKEILKIADESPNQAFDMILSSIKDNDCAFSNVKLNTQKEKCVDLLDKRLISPFDIVLIYAFEWKERRFGLGDENYLKLSHRS